MTVKFVDDIGTARSTKWPKQVVSWHKDAFLSSEYGANPRMFDHIDVNKTDSKMATRWNLPPSRLCQFSEPRHPTPYTVAPFQLPHASVRSKDRQHSALSR